MYTLDIPIKALVLKFYWTSSDIAAFAQLYAWKNDLSSKIDDFYIQN